MLEPSNKFDQFRRSDSFSTVDSSVAAADLMRQYADLSKPSRLVEAINPPHMKFEKSENINVIYNTYYSNPTPEQKLSRNNSFTSFLSGPRRTKATKNFIKFLKTKKGAAIVFVLFVAVLCTIASVISYFFIRGNKPDVSDSTTSKETTTTFNPTTTTTLKPTISTTLTDPITGEPTTDPSNSTTEETTTSVLYDGSTTTEDVTPEDTTTSTAPTTTTSPTTVTTSTTPKPTTTEPNLYPEFFMTRDDWEAEQPRSKNMTKLQTPIKRIIVGHTGGRFCANVTDCIETVKSIQAQDFSLEDIPYNFLIGVDGKVYEGRGFSYQGQHTKNTGATEYNSIGIMIAFIGNYKSTNPSVDQIILLENFIKFFQESGNISSQYSIFSQDDLMYRDVTADSLNGAVANLKNYHSLYKVHRREEWAALTPKVLPKFSRLMNWNIIGHLTSQGCSGLDDCIKEVKKVETDNLKSEYNDIIYNFLVGGLGIVFEGRGWDITGQTNLLPNSAISVMILGDYRYFQPKPEVEQSLKQLFDDGLALGKLTNDFKVFGRSDFGQAGPGGLLMNLIKKWDRYGNKTTY